MLTFLSKISMSGVALTRYKLFSLSLDKTIRRIKESPIGSRLAKGTLWSLWGAILSRGLGLLSSIFVARMLGKESFGALGVIQSTMGLFGIFAGFSLGLTATKYVSEYRVKDPHKTGRIIALSSAGSLVMGVLVAAALAVFADVLAQKVLASSQITVLLRLSAPLLFFDALRGSQTGALSGLEAFKTIARVNIVTGLLSFPLMLIGAFYHGVEGAVLGLVVSAGLNCLFNHFALRNEAAKHGVPLIRKDFFREWQVLWKFSLPAVMGGALVGPANWACTALLVNQPNGYAEMGILNATSQWRTMILFVPGILSTILLPILSTLQGADNRKKYNKVLTYNIILNAGIAFMIAALVSVAAPLIMKSYGKGFESGNIVLTLFCVSAVLMAITNVIGQSIASEGRMWNGLVLNLIWAVVLISTTYFFVDKGAVGLALSNLISYSVHLLTCGIYAYYILYKKNETAAEMQVINS